MLVLAFANAIAAPAQKLTSSQKATSQKRAQTARIFKLGMVKQEVQQSFGQPSGCYVPEDGRYYPIDECSYVHRVWDRVFDVYKRKTSTNEYRIQVIYGPDSRESRLHPKIRLAEINFLLDKPKGANFVLADISEITAWCSSGCKLYGAEDSKLLLCPENPSQEQRKLAALVAADYLPYDGDSDWVPSIELFSEKGQQERGPLSREDWLKLQINQVMFTAASGNCEGRDDLGGFPP
jgi:hypothetical protein